MGEKCFLSESDARRTLLVTLGSGQSLFSPFLRSKMGESFSLFAV
jgi:hypothetical protein